MRDLDLFTDPWIPVVYADGRVGEVGVRQALEDAGAIRDVCAEDPTLTVALFRLLLAVAHRLCGPVDDGRWGDLYRGGLPLDALERIGAGRWRLLDPDRPFAQDPVEGTLNPVEKITAYGRAGGGGMTWARPTALSPAEAARWLVWCHAYDTGGIRGKHGGGREAGVPLGSVGRRTHTRLLGPDLGRTLLLNLAPGAEAPRGEGWWERTEPVTERRKDRSPAGMVDYLCWPSRRIRLVRDDDGMVRTVVVCAGDDLKSHPDPLIGRGQSASASHREVCARGLQFTVPGLYEDADAAPAVAGWLAARHHHVDGLIGVETTEMITNLHGATVEDTTRREIALPASALVPETAAHARLGRLVAMLKTAEDGIGEVTAKAYQRDREPVAAGAARAAVDAARPQWENDLRRLLRGGDDAERQAVDLFTAFVTDAAEQAMKVAAHETSNSHVVDLVGLVLWSSRRLCNEIAEIAEPAPA
ncbi:type I-E CRISPR-associated protein Cse1/CasA [Allonocardiopsis opalescens]|uniref:CRISPR type I-E-associated protein CasA/Cse1 n=1 Tax=Allonocardiopsis opalescens TaxID=1144618 RepID=A0A2T0PSX9_9ACTN|nr:type I-E CRISPR-associated protein Cse1/CasA [Allonocardiopsis opalescens]PRX92000.1 CRISPR type I-E-associated protein CasA/Cse1 [Allonocardiopsis opalescens]